MAITDAATIQHMNAFAFLNPFKDPASLLVPDKEDTHLLEKVRQELPAHLSNPILRVLLVGLTYIALAATLFGIFLLREPASTDVSDFSGTLKGENEKEVARKQARLESALAKLGTHNTPPASDESDEETIASDLDLDSDVSSNWESPPTSSDEDSAMENDMPSLPITTPMKNPVPERRQKVFRNHTRAKSMDFPNTLEWRRPKDENLDSDKGIDAVFNRAIKIPLPLPLKESVKDSSWESPPTSSDEDSNWASPPTSPINHQTRGIYSSVHLSDISHPLNENNQFIGRTEELSL